MSYGVISGQKPPVYNDNQVLTTETKLLYGLGEDADPDDIFKILPIKFNNNWEVLQQWTSSGSYNWTAPDLFNGKTYVVGAMIIGAGGSGAAGYFVSGSGKNVSQCSGGGSGYTVCCQLTITPNTQYPVVVGKGGTYKQADNTNYQFTGVDGGQSSFNNIIAAGGKGGGLNGNAGIGAQCSYAYGTLSSIGPGVFGGTLVDIKYSSSSGSSSNKYGLPMQCFNPFTNQRILGAGGFAGQIGGGSSSNVIATNDAYDPVLKAYVGGSGAIGNTSSPFANATAGRAGGNGGGAAYVYTNQTNGYARSGQGGDGSVILYIKRFH